VSSRSLCSASELCLVVSTQRGTTSLSWTKLLEWPVHLNPSCWVISHFQETAEDSWSIKGIVPPKMGELTLMLFQPRKPFVLHIEYFWHKELLKIELKTLYIEPHLNFFSKSVNVVFGIYKSLLVHQNLLNYINIFPTGLFAQFIHTILFKFSAIFPFSNPPQKMDWISLREVLFSLSMASALFHRSAPRWTHWRVCVANTVECNLFSED